MRVSDCHDSMLAMRLCAYVIYLPDCLWVKVGLGTVTKKESPSCGEVPRGLVTVSGDSAGDLENLTRTHDICFDYTCVFLCIAFALVRLGHRVCHLLFLNGLRASVLSVSGLRASVLSVSGLRASVLSASGLRASVRYISSVHEYGYQACGHQPVFGNGLSADIRFCSGDSDTRMVSCSAIASNPAGIPQAPWTRGRRLHRSEDLIDGQPVFHSLPPVAKRKPKRRSVSEQRLSEQWVISSEDYRTEVSITAAEIDTPIRQMEQQNTSGMEALMRQMQESMRQMHDDAARQTEFSKQQAAVMAQQTPHRMPRTPYRMSRTYKKDTSLPTGPAPPPLLPQLSKVHTSNHPDSPTEVEVDLTALKLSKLEKLFKRSQGVKAMPDIEDGYTEEAVTLPDRFKMPQIDRFDGTGDPMVHIRLFADVLRPMGLTRSQKLSLFGRTLSGIASHWYSRLQDEVKTNWDEMAEAFVTQYSYNTQIEITTRDLETTRQEPKESFSDFVIRWRAKASTMTLRPTDKDQIRMIVRNLHPKLMQRMIVVPFPTFADLHDMGVQIEDAMKQVCSFRSFRVAAVSPASGLPNPFLCLVSVHFAHFGVRFPVFGAVRPCASVRDRLTISACSGFWHTTYLLPFEGHWGLRNPLRYLCFITRKVTEGWEASNCCRNQLSLLRSLPEPVFRTSGPMLNTLGTPCLPSAIPERFAGGLSCQGMTIRLTGCGLCQPAGIGIVSIRPAGISVLSAASGLRASVRYISSVHEYGYQACGHQPVFENELSADIRFCSGDSDTGMVSCSAIASNPAGIPQAPWTRGRRLHRSEDLIDGQPVFHSLPPVAKRKPKRRSVSEQRLSEQWVISSEDYRTEVSITAAEIDTPVRQMEQQNTSGMEALMRQMQESMRQMHDDATRQTEFSKQQAAVMAQQSELITRLQQQNTASASHQIPPPAGAPLPEQAPTVQNAPPNAQNTLPNVQNLQEDTSLPTGPAPPPLLPQLSKVHTSNHPDSPTEVEVDLTALKLSKLEKLFKKSQGVKAMPDIEDGYTEEAVTLPDRFKMPQIDRFDGTGDPMVHIRLFADVLRPMGLTRSQKLSLFGRTLSGIASHWYSRLQDEVKINWDEMAEAFVTQYSYNTQIEITTRDLETTRQEPKESFSDFVIRWRAKASTMTLRPTDKDQIRMIVRNLHPKLMQRMIVVPFPTFADLHDMGVQIEDAMKQGLFDH
ncbi:hypothetical protein HYC85_027746 [Camellia sinensis]|uniref:Retrotransposon gag domain-containing protein n=1 Tax=Camellia sinensis TaxID=4442 RepID=A0A7J7FT77_CAMSI|nr:hypothetical protein HYC85_027746 [Camellia sinensis]